MTRHQAELVIRNNRFRGTAIDSTGAMPNRVMTDGVYAFSGGVYCARLESNGVSVLRTLTLIK
ncbi:MAG TPA: hypothetical protein VK470_03760 [Bacteroidota bacterium]|nr:hypothetical protein [Bacteroidota bacterium]